MANPIKNTFLEKLEEKYGVLKKLPNSLSLYEIANGSMLIYIRYSKLHNRKQAFYGLRKEDLKLLEGRTSVICFLWDEQLEPLIVPFSEFEDIFASILPASDGQYKAQVFMQEEATEFYLANVGRFNVDGFFGWRQLDRLIKKSQILTFPSFSHQQIQTLIGSIGVTKGYDVWIPFVDRGRLDWNLTKRFSCPKELPKRYSKVIDIIREIDVLWLKRGSSDLKSIFEIEHSTPVYSGLLRFNDLHLVEPNLGARFSIVSNDERRSLFLRQINRPTFTVSRLLEVCNFLEYKDVYNWFTNTGGEQIL